MRFVADVMLARLARWLRMLGVSVSPPRSASDDEIIRQCMDDSAMLITRDVALAQKAADYAPCVLLRSAALDGQVMEFCAATGFDLAKIKFSDVPNKTLCPNCNGRLKKTAKALLKSKVPKKSWLNAKEFFLCASCGKAYWEGSHDRKILEGLQRLQRKQAALTRASSCIPS